MCLSCLVLCLFCASLLACSLVKFADCLPALVLLVLEFVDCLSMLEILALKLMPCLHALTKLDCLMRLVTLIDTVDVCLVLCDEDAQFAVC